MNEVSDRLFSRVFDCDRLPDAWLCAECEQLWQIARQVEVLETELVYLKTKLRWHEGAIKG